MNCTACGAELLEGTTHCIRCGLTLAQLCTDGVITTPSAATLGVGHILAGRYEVLEEIGQGGMGWVYRAHDRDLRETVALKVLYPHFASEARVLDRFKQEARIARRVSHPNVVRVHDIGQSGDLVYMSMEFLSGESLKELLERRGRLGLDEALGIVRQLCAGLDAAHRIGIIHLDVKPHNVFLPDDGTVKIVDFGIAMAGSLAVQGRIDEAMGTPAYMAPERFEPERGLDRRADVYSVGILLYEVFVGHVPFRGQGPVETALKQLRERPTAPRRAQPAIDPALERVILRCLEKDPARRYATLPELLRDLESVAAGEPRRVAGGGPPWRPLVAVAAAVVAVVALWPDPPPRVATSSPLPDVRPVPPSPADDEVPDTPAPAESAGDPVADPPEGAGSDGGAIEAVPVAPPVLAPLLESEPLVAPAPVAGYPLPPLPPAPLVAGVTEPPPEAEAATGEPEPPTEVERLLALAADRFARQHFLLPREANAHDLYREVLALEPGNAVAQRGLADMKDWYLRNARARIAGGELEKALVYAQRARRVDPSDAETVRLAARIEADIRAAREHAATPPPTPQPVASPPPLPPKQEEEEEEGGFFDFLF